MINWLERAQREIPEMAGRGTANTDARGLTAVMAVAHPRVSGISEAEESFEDFNVLPAIFASTSLDEDDRRPCESCANLTPRGLCMAAWRGELPPPR